MGKHQTSKLASQKTTSKANVQETISLDRNAAPDQSKPVSVPVVDSPPLLKRIGSRWSNVTFFLAAVFLLALGIYNTQRSVHTTNPPKTAAGLQGISKENKFGQLEKELLGKDLKIYLVWSTPESTFQERNFKVLDAYLYHHPTASITVFATHLPFDFFRDYVDAGYRVGIHRIDDAYLTEMGNQCPGKSWITEIDRWRKGPYFYSHLTDFLRFCLLYLHGGVYSDFDALLLQPIGPYDTFIGKDSSGAGGSCAWCLPGGDLYLAPGLMGATKGSRLAKNALQIGFESGTYDQDVFNAVGPTAVTKAYKQDNRKVAVLDRNAFYPYTYTEAKDLFSPQKDARAVLEKLRRTSTSLHLYGHQTRHLAVKNGSIAKAVFDRFSVVERNCDARMPRMVVPKFLGYKKRYERLEDVRVISPCTGHAKVTNYEVSLESKYGRLHVGGARKKMTLNKVTVFGPTAMSINVQLSRLIYEGSHEVTDGRDTIFVTLTFKTEGKEISGSQDSERAEIFVYDISSMVTILAKTMGRMDKVFNLVRSAHEFYPGTRIIVSDDEKEAYQRGNRSLNGFEYVPLPYDAGLSAGRNQMIQLTETEYFLTLDDDFVFDEHSRIENLVHALEIGGFDIAAGKNPVDEKKFELDFSGFMKVENRTLFLVPGDHGLVADCRVVEFVPNIFVARTDRFKGPGGIRWDENLKLGEHEDFFWRAKKLGLRVGTCPSVSFNHDQVEHWKGRTAYDRMRGRVYQFLKASLRKHGLLRLVSFGKIMMDLILPPPIISLHVSELLDDTVNMFWISPSPSFRIMCASKGGNTFFVNNGEGDGWLWNSIPVRDLTPGTHYMCKVYAGNRFEYETKGMEVKFRTMTRNEVLAKNIIRNPSFEMGHFLWEKSIGSHFHIVDTARRSGDFGARLQIITKSYQRPNPTDYRISQTIPLSHMGNNIRSILVKSHARVEKLYGTGIEWRLAARATFEDGKTIQWHEEYDSSSPGWQFRSFSLCLETRHVRVREVTVSGILRAYRGAVYFDDFVVVVVNS